MSGPDKDMGQRPLMRIGEEDYDQPFVSRTMKRMREDPVFPIAVGGWCGIVGLMLYKVKQRKQPLQLHLIHTRMYAQIFTVGCMLTAVSYNIFRKKILKQDEPKELPSSKSLSDKNS